MLTNYTNRPPLLPDVYPFLIMRISFHTQFGIQVNTKKQQLTEVPLSRVTRILGFSMISYMHCVYPHTLDLTLRIYKASLKLIYVYNDYETPLTSHARWY